MSEFAQMDRAGQMHALFDKYAVEADSVADFLVRYYRRERYTDTLLASYEEEFNELGICWISHHDNVTGDVVSFLGKGEAGSFEQNRRGASRAISVPGGSPTARFTVPTQIAVPSETQREKVSGKPGCAIQNDLFTSSDNVKTKGDHRG